METGNQTIPISTQLLKLATYDANSIPENVLQEQFNYYFYLVNKTFFEIKDKTVELNSNVVLVPIIILNLLSLQKKIDSTGNKNHQKLANIVDFVFDASAAAPAQPSKSFFQQTMEVINLNGMISIFSHLFKPQPVTYRKYIEFAFAQCKDISDYFPELELEVFPKPLADIFNEMEFSSETIEVIPEMIPDIQSPELFLLFMFIIGLVFKKDHQTPKINAPHLDSVLIQCRQQIDFTNLAKIGLYFKSGPIQIDAQADIEFQKFIILNLLAGFQKIQIKTLNLDNPSIFEIFIYFFYQAKYLHLEDTENVFNTLQPIIDRNIKNQFALAKYIISQSYCDVNLMLYLKESKKSIASAKKLLSMPQCLPYLDKSNPIHAKVYSILQPWNNDFIKVEDDIEKLNLINLFRLINDTKISESVKAGITE